MVHYTEFASNDCIVNCIIQWLSIRKSIMEEIDQKQQCTQILYFFPLYYLVFCFVSTVIICFRCIPFSSENVLEFASNDLNEFHKIKSHFCTHLLGVNLRFSCSGDL